MNLNVSICVSWWS
jgi:hypothetical protein